jgi:hypothetical protein
MKKRRMVNGTELVFQKPRGDEEESEGDEELGPSPLRVPEPQESASSLPDTAQAPVIDTPKIVIYDD